MYKYVPVTASPFGPNIHFVYDMKAGKIIYLHHSLDWLIERNDGTASVEEISGQVQPEHYDSLIEAFKNLLTGSFVGSVSACFENKSGRRWLRITPYIHQSDVETILASVEDFTDLANNDAVLVKYANKKNSILHMLAHDLRGPLGAAKGLVKTLARKNPELEIKTGHIASIIEQSIGLIDSLIQREYLESLDVTLVKKSLNVVKLLKDYIEECKRSNILSGRILSFQSTADEIRCELDNGKFMQIINNLISNALKFTREGGEISMSVSETPGTVEITVADNGIGIPGKFIPVLFDKFTAASRPGLDGEPTIGLGMSIVKMVTEWHEGEIRCESEEGKGTTFFISIPKQVTNQSHGAGQR